MPWSSTYGSRIEMVGGSWKSFVGDLRKPRFRSSSARLTPRPPPLERAREQGLPYVTKPFSPARLVGLIGEVIGGAATQSEDVDP